MLGQYHESGRYYVDLEDLVKDEKNIQQHIVPKDYLSPEELTKDYLLKTAGDFPEPEQNLLLPDEEIKQIVEAGNYRPFRWKFPAMEICI